jgi:hypothetical protein
MTLLIAMSSRSSTLSAAARIWSAWTESIKPSLTCSATEFINLSMSGVGFGFTVMSIIGVTGEILDALDVSDLAILALNCVTKPYLGLRNLFAANAAFHFFYSLSAVSTIIHQVRSFVKRQ